MNRSLIAACQLAVTARLPPQVTLPVACHKQRAITAAPCTLAGVTFTVTDDDRRRPLFVVTPGADTHLFQTLNDVDHWLDECKEVIHEHQ